MKKIPFFCAALCLWLFPLSYHYARPCPGLEQEQPVLKHEVTVALKLVQVYATDKRGNPVTDLRKDEFTLFDDKNEKRITEFERHVMPLPEKAAAVPVPAEKAAEPAANPPSPLLSRRFFLLFDLVFTEGKGFNLAREAALRFLKTDLVPTDEVSLLLFSGGRSLAVRKLPTRDHGAVYRAIESLRASDLLDRVFNEGETSGRIFVSADASTHSVQVGPSSGSAPEIRILAGNFIWAMKSLAQALRLQPGQKNVILYSRGIKPETIGRGQFGGANDLSRAFEDMCKELAAAGVSIFPINTEDPDPFKMARPNYDPGEKTLLETAKATGGQYLGYAASSDKPMKTVNNITGMYYVLGYPISQAWDGRFHTIRVKTSRPDCEVHAQPGYFNPKPFAQYSKIEKEIDLVDLALAGKPISQEPMSFAMQALPESGLPQDNLVFVAEVPADVLSGLAGPKVEVANLVFNPLDEIVDSRRCEVALGEKAPYQKPAFILSALSARPGTYKCRIVLRNLETGKAAVAGVTAVVLEAEAGQLFVFPPLLASEAAGTVYLSGKVDQREGRPAPEARAAEAFLLDVKKHAPCLGNELAAGAAMTVAVKCAVPGGDASGLGLSAKLTSQASGEEQALPLTVLEKKTEKGAQIFLARIVIPRAAPGRYELALIVSDSRSGLSAQVARGFSIK